MARFTYMLNSFRSGELGPKTHARTDAAQYANGLDTLQNFLPYPSGGVARRAGLGVSSIRNAAGLVQGTSFNIIFKLDRKSIYTLELGFDSVSGIWGVASVGATGTPLYSVGVGTVMSAEAIAALGNITNTDINGFNYVQIDQVIVLTHNSSLMEPIIIRPSIGFSNDINFRLEAWTTSLSAVEPLVPSENWSNLPITVRMPFQDPNVGPITLAPSSNPGDGVTSINVTASTAFWEANHIGSYYLLDNAGEIMTVVITGITSPTVATAFIRGYSAGYSVGASDYWYESSWSQRRGWPKCVEVHNGRLIFAGTTINPCDVWGSFPFSYGQFSRHTGFAVNSKDFSGNTYSRDASAIDGGVQYTIASQGAPDQIAWIKSQRTLLVGTANREYIADLSPSNVFFTPQSNHGSSPYPATNGFNSTFFISEDGQRIFEIRYSEENGSFVSRDLTNLNSEILHRGNDSRADSYIQLIWNDSFKTLFCLTSTGKVKTITVEPSAEMTAIADMVIEDTVVTHMANSFSPEANNFIFPLFKAYRTDNPATQEWSLILTDFFEGEDPLNESPSVLSDVCFYLDFGIISLTPFAPTAAITVGTEYNGMTLDFLCEAEAGGLVVYQGILVAGGAVALPANITKYVAGVSYTSKLKTLTLEVGPNNTFNSQGDIIRIDRATVKLFKSWVGKYGTDETLYDFEKLGLTGSYTGEERVDVPIGPGTENKITIETDQPLPLNILGMVLRGNNNP